MTAPNGYTSLKGDDIDLLLTLYDDQAPESMARRLGTIQIVSKLEDVAHVKARHAQARRLAKEGLLSVQGGGPAPFFILWSLTEKGLRVIKHALTSDPIRGARTAAVARMNAPKENARTAPSQGNGRSKYTADMVARAKAMKAEGKTHKEIARELGDIPAGSVAGMLDGRIKGT